MDYSRIVAVTGLPGLFEVVNSKTDGAIVKSLEDQSTKFISSRIHNLSHLESIEVYTVRENVTLADVFIAMKESGTALPDVKDNKALRSYFEKVFPDMDFDRVYSSDQKKMVRWFEVLQQNQVDFTVKPQEEEDQEEVAEETPAVKQETVKAKPKATEKIKEKEEEKKAPKARAGEKKTKSSAEKAPASKSKKAAPKKAAKKAAKKK